MANVECISNEEILSDRLEGLDIVTKSEMHPNETEEATGGVTTYFRKSPVKKVHSAVSLTFPDIISTVTCSELVIELIKYVIYLKNQIPYQYNHLKAFVDRKKKWDLEKDPTRELLHSIPRLAVHTATQHFSKASQVVESFELIFQHLRVEIDSVSAVALLLGATIASPNEVYIIEVPQLFPSASASAPSRGCLAYLLRELVTSEILEQMTRKACRPCNIHILLRKAITSTQDSWFEVKPLYSIPSNCSQVSLKFCQPPSAGEPKFKIYVETPSPKCPSPLCKSATPHTPQDCPVEPSQWFQAQKYIKGFKDCYIQGECATDLWMKI